MIRLGKNSNKLLKLFYNHPGESFYIQQIGRILRRKPGVFQRSLYNMEKEGILKSEYKANARFFSINKEYSLYKEFKSIVSKTKDASVVLLIVFLPFFITASGFCSEDNSKATVLASLEDAIKIAFKNNKDIQIQEQEIEVARADILAARSQFLPNINLNAGYTRNAAVLTQSSAGLKKDYGVFAGYKNDNKLGVSLGQTIYSGGANLANLRQAQLGLTEQEETLRAVKLNVELEAKRLYYGLLLAYETKRIAENLVSQTQAHYENVKKRFEQGSASKFDVLQSKVQVSLVMPQLTSALSAIDLIRAELNQLLGLKIQDPLDIRDNLSFSPIEIREDEFLKQAYLYKPEMILESLGIDINKWAIKFARAGWLPQLSASADYTFRSNNLTNMLNNRHNNWSVGAALTIPIFDGFATKAKVDAAKAKLREAILSKGNVSDQIAVSVRQACLDLKQAYALIISQRDNLEDAHEALKIAEVRYDNGLGINLDVLDTQVSLAQVEENLAQAIYDYILAKARLDRNRGEEFLKEAKNEKKD